jgi:hypothetical protein
MNDETNTPTDSSSTAIRDQSRRPWETPRLDPMDIVDKTNKSLYPKELSGYGPS